LQSRGDAPAVEQAADQGYSERVSTRRAGGSVFIGVSDGRRRVRRRPVERRDEMRLCRRSAEVALQRGRNVFKRARAPSGAAVAWAFPAVHSTLAEHAADHSRPFRKPHGLRNTVESAVRVPRAGSAYDELACVFAGFFSPANFHYGDMRYFTMASP
jgi:hypothetical protein